MKKNLALLTTCLIGASLLSACSPPAVAEKQTAVQQQRTQAAAEAATEQTYCYECNNIKNKRIRLGKPGVIGYVAFLNQAGQPVMYTAVAGKCTSGSKRLTPTDQPEYVGNGNGGYNFTMRQAIGEDGVYGPSESYVYCFTADGRYLQWSGEYLYSDKPFDFTIKPLVIDTTGKDSHQ